MSHTVIISNARRVEIPSGKNHKFRFVPGINRVPKHKMDDLVENSGAFARLINDGTLKVQGGDAPVSAPATVSTPSPTQSTEAPAEKPVDDPSVVANPVVTRLPNGQETTALINKARDAKDVQSLLGLMGEEKERETPRSTIITKIEKALADINDASEPTTDGEPKVGLFGRILGKKSSTEDTTNDYPKDLGENVWQMSEDGTDTFKGTDDEVLGEIDRRENEAKKGN